MHFCFRKIPYYREKFAEIGAMPDDFREPEDLVHFPLLEKETLRDRIEDFLDPSVDRSGLIRYRSSGSTGIPLELWYLPAERLQMGFVVTRELLYNGMKPWHRLVNITEPRHSSPKNRWYHRLGIMQERFLSVYDSAQLNLQELLRIRPQALIGFPSVLMLVGKELNAVGAASFRPRLLFTIAEVLTAEDRRILKELWGVEPIDLYGANEVGHIAFQCRRRQGYHINADTLHVEILAGDRPAKYGEPGEIVVTNFDLRVIPILRYRVGDVASFLEGVCPCGCRFPLLQNIAGRSDGFIQGADGTLFSALEISLLLKPLQDVEQYRLIQEAPGRITVEWKAKHAKANPEEQIRRLLRGGLGEAFRIEVVRVAEIPREKSGKIRSVISRLPHPFRSATS
jgi:phenylacetate-CoA ligase